MRAGRSPNTVVASYSLDGKLIRVYPSAKKAAYSLHHHPRSIDKAIREVKVIHDRQWRRFPIDEVPEKIPPFVRVPISLKARPIAMIDEDNSVIKTYPSIRQASLDNKTDPHLIREVLYGKCKQTKGKKYRYLTEEEIKESGFNSDRFTTDRVGVRQYSFSGELIAVFDTIHDAAKKVKVDKSTIGLCVNKKCLSAKGFYWIKDDEKAPERLKELMGRKKFYYTTIIQMDKNKNVIAKYDSTKEAAKATGLSGKFIGHAIRFHETAGGFYWIGKK